MTVSELIEELRKYPPDEKVRIYDSDLSRGYDDIADIFITLTGTNGLVFHSGSIYIKSLEVSNSRDSK